MSSGDDDRVQAALKDVQRYCEAFLGQLGAQRNAMTIANAILAASDGDRRNATCLLAMVTAHIARATGWEGRNGAFGEVVAMLAHHMEPAPLQ